MARDHVNATFRNEPDQSRIAAVLDDGTVAGYAAYRRDGSTYTFDHTVVEPEHEGQGLGGRLAEAAVGLVREEGATLVPHCSFIRAYIDAHPDAQDLVAGS